jgi:hypothetical protein
MSVPTTVTMNPDPVNDAKLPVPKLRADNPAPLIDPLIVARSPVVVGVLVEPDNWLGADGEGEPHAALPSAMAMSDTYTITFR